MLVQLAAHIFVLIIILKFSIIKKAKLGGGGQSPVKHYY